LTAKSEFVESLHVEAKESSQLDKEVLPPTTLTAAALRSWIMEALASYNDTGSGEALGQVLEVLQKVLRGSMSMSGDRDDTTDGQLQHIRRLGEGDMTLASAQKFINAFKVSRYLCSYNPSR
jgi:hypothetical protein